MEERRGLSLRKKRSVKPKISAPRPLPGGAGRAAAQGPSGSSPAPGPQSSAAPKPKAVQSSSVSRAQASGNTADYVKRRLSTRITHMPKDMNGAPPVPSLPTLPTLPTLPALGTDHTSKTHDKPQISRPIAERGEVPVDMKALQDPRLNVDQYIANLLADSSEQEIREYQQNLSNIKNRASTDLQHSVYQNRSQFIKISQEADRLKTEMRTLRNLMSELTNTLGQTNAALGIQTENVTARKHANRSSVANLEAMWSTHLQELWRRVEGSQKFLPAGSGRHVLQESRRWMELNVATYKPRRRVHLILLNDHLLVAVEKKRPEQSSPSPGDNKKSRTRAAPTQLVAEKCWPLQDIEITDILGDYAVSGRRGSQRSPINAINVRSGQDSCAYLSTDDTGADKNTLVARFRKAVAELRRLVPGEIPEENETDWNKTKSIAKSIGASSPLPQKTDARKSMMIDVEGKQKNFQWVESEVDALDIGIALHNFETAVEKVETLRKIAKGNKNNTIVQELINGKVQERADKLANTITRQLVDTNSFMTRTQENVSWLRRLGHEQQGCEMYLQARSDVIDARTGQCADTGDLHQYLYQISFIYFTLIRNTVTIFQKCFSQSMGSASVTWAKEHVDAFNQILSRQMSKLEPDSEEWQFCLDQARQHAGILQDVHMDFSGLIDGKSKA